jgi:hypothetical protein
LALLHRILSFVYAVSYFFMHIANCALLRIFVLLSIIMLSVIMFNVVILKFILLSVIMMNVFLLNAIMLNEDRSLPYSGATER